MRIGIFFDNRVECVLCDFFVLEGETVGVMVDHFIREHHSFFKNIPKEKVELILARSKLRYGDYDKIINKNDNIVLELVLS